MPENYKLFEQAFPVPESIAWGMILPIAIVILTGLVAMILEVMNPKRTNNVTVGVSLVGLVAALFAVVPNLGNVTGSTLAGMFLKDNFGSVCQILLILGCLLTIMFSEPYLREKRIPYGEFYPLILWSTAGGMLMSTSTNLLVMFIGLEMLSIALYVLAGMSRRETKSEESAMKYFLLGSFASGFFLFGIAQYYGASGTLDISYFAQIAGSDPLARTMVLFAFGLMIVGIGFKAALVPFHQWTPDVYQGAPTNVTAFMAVVSKTAAIAVMFRLLEAASGLFNLWGPALQVIAILTMVVGNAVALLQTDVKRILGYSSVAHAGYLLVGLLAASAKPEIGTGSVLYYLLAYGLMTIGAFAVVTIAAKGGKEGTNLSDLNGLWKRSPAAAFMMVIFVVSLIGIPPLAGFFGKMNFFRDAMDAGMPHLAIVLAATSILSVAYYLRILMATAVSDENEGQVSSSFNAGMKITTALCAFGLIAITLFFDPVVNLLGGTTGETISASTSQELNQK